MNQLSLEQFISQHKKLASSSNLLVLQVAAADLKQACNFLYKEQQLPFKYLGVFEQQFIYVFARPAQHQLIALLTPQHTESLTDIIPSLAVFETRIKEAGKEHVFSEVAGEGIYEVPVGPVHAGIIEPGHFRFSLAGEEIRRLEPQLMYKHKGTEKLMTQVPLDRQIKLAERVAGDTSFTHAWAFCQTLEKLAQLELPKRAQYLRVIYSELERLANHFNDVGFILLDTGYSFGGSNGARLREKIMRLHEKISGSRFLRGVNIVGGVKFDLSANLQTEISQTIAAMEQDFSEIIAIARQSSIIDNRLRRTGIVTPAIALQLQMVGIAARASGRQIDARHDFPYGVYADLPFTQALEMDGDVNARFNVRVHEIHTSCQLILQALQNLPAGEIALANPQLNLPANSWSAGITEGWRGEIIYIVATDSQGKIQRVLIKDPSISNWTGTPHAGPGNILPDFPLINKSFNLSYSGSDL